MEHSTINVDGDDHKALLPVILSASRSTDIPAFYSEWFVKRLHDGFIRWKNPFNQKMHYVDLSSVAGVVFWSKNPKPIFPYLKILDDRKIDYYFQYTVNDYEVDGFEPGVPRLKDRIDTFKRLSDKLGKDRVIWRFDPICLSDTISVHTIIEKIVKVGDEIADYTEQLVISFVDIQAYSKVKRNICIKGSCAMREPSLEEQDVIAQGVSEYVETKGLNAYTCGEARSFSKFGIARNKCIDGELFAKICSPENYRLQKHLGIKTDQFSLLDAKCGELSVCKDKGQRSDCGCIESKDIGMYNTCPHMCMYCYANNSKNVVLKNYNSHSADAAGIVKG
ncbi:DUF1848 domain-containing protein [Desulfovibrio psychrotolerans]|uniref:DUF1848 domain-containing protein n=1 Tax=Desulfovibrio psychrotolerans TaxID=415242 RepID=A0A7J0BYE0_9BACT|nr:DUF1848 domain-containing protein [Desulfovibrio psychrotolerans]GFM38215.1 hypothetical protein DSM19430T_28990 [Desulfovibrio psychrotolerans]